METNYIPEAKVVKELVEFIREVADVDYLAQWYSFVITNNPIVVVPRESNKRNSVLFQHGERVETDES